MHYGKNKAKETMPAVGVRIKHCCMVTAVNTGLAAIMQNGLKSQRTSTRNHIPCADNLVIDKLCGIMQVAAWK